MKAPASFQIATTPLQRGVTLIEASAGTGKTFTIAGLFLRLLIEQKLSVSEILVVTYTEAATEELRGRIRQALADAAAAFVSGTSSTPFLQSLLEQSRGSAKDILAGLEQALSNFDEAPIFTIHGFCQRQLRDRAFECGAPFDTELLTDPSALQQEIADDYWRRRFYEADPLVVQFALKNRLGPERLLPELELHSRHPALRIISAVDGRRFDELVSDLRTAFARARDTWRAEQAAIRQIFAQAGEWAIKDYAKPDVVSEQLSELERCFSDDAAPESFKCLKFFSATAIAAGTSKKADAAPTHEFFDCCDTLGQRESEFLIGLRLDFLDFARAELPRRKQRLKVQSFDDLLTRLHAALLGSGGERLAGEVRAKYKAALIDEFQDTDPVQYQIFRRLFAGPPNGQSDATVVASSNHNIAPDEPLHLFLIGDPKQAIYGFRGADFFTYLDAVRRADRRFTLDANWRSESGLVTAVNTLFQRATAPFVFDEIPFHPVVARGEADLKPLREGDRSHPQFHLWFFPRDPDAREISQARAEEILPGVVASEIARLLNGDTRIGDRPAGPQDIAVLVLKHSQAALMQEALRALKIPSVLHTEASLFASEEARDLERVLAAIAEPSSERMVRAALTTGLIGTTGVELDALNRDELPWQRRLESFHRYSNLWIDQGFTPMMRALLHDEQIRQRLLLLPDGERRLTNVLHLAEALHQAALERRLGPAGLTQWLADHIASQDKAAEEHQLRLERDDFAVRLVTIHKSKGLEYPIVFCPFAWKSSDLKWAGEEQVFFHERLDDGDSRFVRDLGSKNYDRHREIAFREKLAENVRLLYVALTRARNRCYFVWGSFKNAGTSAPAWLLHPRELSTICTDDVLNARFKSLDDASIRAHLEKLVAESAGPGAGPTILLRDMPAPDLHCYRPPAESAIELTPRTFNGTIQRDWRTTSFSALATHRRDDQPDHDPAGVLPPLEPAEEGTIFAFPRGTNAGTCLHKIFECVDFTTPDDGELDRIVRDQLRVHGFDAERFAPAVVNCVRRSLEVPLDPARPGLKLAAVPLDGRLNELEFTFPLKRTTPASIRDLFAGASGDAESSLSRLKFDPVQGYVQGFIDLVFRLNETFYVVDWKSNWLGNRVEDYHQEAMRREMNERLYPLQYHLYTVALHQHLGTRLRGYEYEKHFGGVFYLFVRGIDPMRPELGVFHDRPSAKRIGSLSERLLAKLGGTTT
jgi:exodeoxyribonuclease V beta subunit